jgi:hypothetical protein
MLMSRTTLLMITSSLITRCRPVTGTSSRTAGCTLFVSGAFCAQSIEYRYEAVRMGSGFLASSIPAPIQQSTAQSMEAAARRLAVAIGHNAGVGPEPSRGDCFLCDLEGVFV